MKPSYLIRRRVLHIYHLLVAHSLEKRHHRLNVGLKAILELLRDLRVVRELRVCVRELKRNGIACSRIVYVSVSIVSHSTSGVASARSAFGKTKVFVHVRVRRIQRMLACAFEQVHPRFKDMLACISLSELFTVQICIWDVGEVYNNG